MIADRLQPRRRIGTSVVLALTFSLAVALLAVPAAHAQDCNIGTGLAATILIPYFEVDPGNPVGTTTIFSVVNESNQATLTRVVFWTDWGIPTLSFDVYLEPRDLQTFNIRDQFNGNLPSTGEGADLSGFQFCELADFRPIHSNPALNPDERAQLVADHQGVVGPLEPQCAGENHGDGLLRGYITVDVVDECSGIQLDETFTPAWGGYFDEGGGSGGIAVAQNRLWGDFTIVDPANAFAQGSEAVALWADPSRFTGDPTFTFYGRYSSYDGRDERVPVPSLWNSRFLNGGVFSGGTDLIVWRDTGSADVSRKSCFGGKPGWFPLNTSFITARDEDAENPVFLTDSTAFPLATQRVSTATFGFPYPFGRVQLGLADGPGLTNQRQAWVQSILSASGEFSLGQNARAINELCDSAP